MPIALQGFMTSIAAPNKGWIIGLLPPLLLCAVLLLAAWAISPTSTPAMRDASLPSVGTVDMARLAEKGRRKAVAECMACHSATAERPFAGGVPVTTPVGRIRSSNISPDPASGIGRYSLDDFDRAIRHAVARDGRTLIPITASDAYGERWGHVGQGRIPDAELKALYVYLMHDVQAMPDANPSSDLVWPLSMRWPWAAWRKARALFHETSQGVDDLRPASR